MIGGAMAGGGRGHVGQHQIGLAAQRLFQHLRHAFVHKIALEDFDPGDRLHRQNVGGDDLAAAAKPLRGDLAPAARRRAEIEHQRAGPQQMEFAVEFFQLERRARTVAFGLRRGDVRIVKLALKPAGGRSGAPTRGQHPLVLFATPRSRIASSQRFVSANRSRKIPSRRPRSATRKRAQGHTLWMAL